MVCSNCGAPIPENSAFCVMCGTPVAKEETEEVAAEAVVEEAVAEAYRQVEHVHFDNAYYRKDIGAKALAAKEA